jgi:DNA-directed RNA polymerase subunit omega
MARITIEDCMRAEGNRFSLVLMAAIRTKQIMRGARPLVRSEENKSVVISLREIAAGNVRADVLPAADLPAEPDEA